MTVLRSPSTIVSLFLTVCLTSTATAFVPSSTSSRTTTASAFRPHDHAAVVGPRAPTTRTTTTTRLFSSDPQKTNKSGLDEELRNKLVSESIAPWRTVRLFLYFALGSGAFVGGLINLSEAVAALNGLRGPDVDMDAEYLNLAIDFGAVAAFAVFAKLDLDKQQELDDSVSQKMERRKEQKRVAKGMEARAQQLAGLDLEIQVSSDGQTRTASVRELQVNAKQHLILVAGPKKACRDALVGANLLKTDFAMSNVLVTTYETDVDAVELQVKPTGSGFADTRPIYETQPYVAQAVGDGWNDYIQAELTDAVAQNGEKAKEEGIAIVVANNGKVVRRGVGKVPWRQMVEQLDAEVKA